MSGVAAEQGSEHTALRSLSLGLRAIVLTGRFFLQSHGATLNLGATDLVALDQIFLDGPLTPSELAQRLALTTGSVTPLVDRIQAAGFVMREGNPNDRRSMLVRTTSAGNEVMERLYAEVDATLQQTLEGLAPLSRAAIEEVFRQANASLRRTTVTAPNRTSTEVVDASAVSNHSRA
ncbi:MarR family transcriptional regulator [Okibacterium sp. HSC-33S16]|uniref:MarR family transcriptional regulator n=1 Tax=Okibacterium sp. HSC-33S16 TaxID=2910965 RepID=UPI0035A96F0A